MSKPQMPKRPKPSMRVLGRTMKMLFSYYPVLMPLIVLCILVAAVTAAIPPVFMQKVIAEIEVAVANGSDWATASKTIIPMVVLLGVFYAIAWVLIALQTQLMAIVTQGFLCKLRRTMFAKPPHPLF